jgi:hypothetical protein
MAEDPDQVSLPLAWIGVEDVPVLASNQMLIQFSAKDEFLLTFGHVGPPIVLGTQEQQREQLKTLTYAPVKPVARLGLTRQRVEEVIKVLTESLESHDKAFQ